ncbi:hypothetical protein BLNAU_18281 [Blattamonas nauphoetae]|uniref:Uncharacterized protein n=1 Tax=Blattamonas nauphoetae TaxID=2049346 RepID=A0ABQ9X4X7_9EUKA|nr:hypothetical protein BLNAU_18281 [Blattamonas nauphoetae]
MHLVQYHLEWMTCSNPDSIWTERNEILMIQYLNQKRHLQHSCLVDQRGHFHPHYLPQTIPQYLTVTCLALSLLLFRHDQRISTAMCADIAVFHLIGMTCSFVGNDKTRLNTIMWIVWALAFLGVSMGVFFLSRTWAFTNPNEATNGPPSIFPHSCHSLRQQPKITRKLPHSQSIRVSNQPQYVETSNFRPQSPVEAVERTTLKESSKMHKYESSAGSHQIFLC